MTSVAMHGRAPYRQVLTHGFTVDAKGEKMSKSKGNVVSPQDVMKTLGADIIRLWVAATDYRTEMNVSDEILKRTADAYRRIRNTARFLLANLNGFDPATNLVAPEAMVELDRWAVDRAYRLQEEVIDAYRDYQFHLDLSEGPAVLRGRHGRLLSGRHQGPPVHHPGRQPGRGAPARPPCITSSRP